MDWAKHRRRKAAAKCHVRLNLQTFLPHFAFVDTVGEHDSASNASALTAQMPALRVGGAVPGALLRPCGASLLP
jgi:hypothetical protein